MMKYIYSHLMDVKPDLGNTSLMLHLQMRDAQLSKLRATRIKKQHMYNEFNPPTLKDRIEVSWIEAHIYELIMDRILFYIYKQLKSKKTTTKMDVVKMVYHTGLIVDSSKKTVYICSFFGELIEDINEICKKYNYSVKEKNGSIYDEIGQSIRKRVT